MTSRGGALPRAGEGQIGPSAGKAPAPAVSLVIHGAPPSKNDRQIVRFGTKAAIQKGKRTKQWERSAWDQIREQLAAAGLREPFTGDVRISGTVFYRTRQSDLDLSLIQDVLQGPLVRGKLARGRRHRGLVIVDDGQVTEYGRWLKRLDAERPRVEIVVELIGAEQKATGL